jgi:hypothetical protein
MERGRLAGSLDEYDVGRFSARLGCSTRNMGGRIASFTLFTEVKECYFKISLTLSPPLLIEIPTYMCHLGSNET